VLFRLVDSTGVPIQDLRQELYLLSHAPSPFSLVIFQIGSHAFA
jgi:hypothetical protein